MSLTRSFFHEFRPFFRMLEDKSMMNPAIFHGSSRFARPRYTWGWETQPNVDLTDKGDAFVVEADLPGVKRENLEVRVGDRGRSLTIEARTAERSTENGKTNEQGMILSFAHPPLTLLTLQLLSYRYESF